MKKPNAKEILLDLNRALKEAMEVKEALDHYIIDGADISKHLSEAINSGKDINYSLLFEELYNFHFGLAELDYGDSADDMLTSALKNSDDTFKDLWPYKKVVVPEHRRSSDEVPDEKH